MSTILASTLITAETAPNGPEDLWDPGSLLRHNWAETVEMTRSWPGAISTARSGAEKRTVFLSRPRLTTRFTITAIQNGEVWRLKNVLRRMGIARQVVPIWCDAQWTTAGLSGGGTTVTVTSTANRRFYQGGRVAIGTPSLSAPGCALGTYEIATISSVTGTTIDLTAGVTNSYPAGSRIVPLMECEVLAVSEGKRIPGGKLEAHILAEQVPGEWTLPALASPGGSGVYSTFTVSSVDYPIFEPGFNPSLEWLSDSDGWDRVHNVARIGQGQVFTLLGPRPRNTAKRATRAITRADAFNILTLFDACQGPLRPFFAPAPLPMLKVISMTTTTVVVQSFGPVEDWSDYPYLAAVKIADGPTACRIRAISSVARASGQDTITLTSALDFSTVGQVWYCVPANLMRFAGEDLTERWKTSEFCELDFSLIEVLSDAAVSFLGPGGHCEGGGDHGPGGSPLDCTGVTANSTVEATVTHAAEPELVGSATVPFTLSSPLINSTLGGGGVCENAQFNSHLGSFDCCFQAENLDSDGSPPYFPSWPGYFDVSCKLAIYVVGGLAYYAVTGNVDRDDISTYDIPVPPGALMISGGKIVGSLSYTYAGPGMGQLTVNFVIT
jgi:hypothetical protein